MLVVVLGTLASRGAAADPAMPRVLTAPTAWLPAPGGVIASAGIDRRGDATATLAIGLGMASIEVGADSDVRGCVTCDGDRKGDALVLGRAAFRLGAQQDAWFPGMPALTLGLRNTFAARGHAFGAARVTEAYLVASRVMGPIRLHLGGAVSDAGHHAIDLGPTLRPFAGLEWTPRPYPRTSVLADVMWLPRLEPDRVALEWLAGWGVRYQALSFAAVELAVRHRQDEGLAESTVLVRVVGVWNPRGAEKKSMIAR